MFLETESSRTVRSENLDELYEAENMVDEVEDVHNRYTVEVVSGRTGGSSHSSSLSWFDDFGDIRPSVVGVVGIISLIIAVIVFATLIKRKTAPRGRFMKWLREYLNFRTVFISSIIKLVYVFLAVFLTIMSVVIMFQGRDDTVLTMILVGLATMILGNILLRIMMEFTMALIVVWENTSDIRGVLVKDEERPEEKKPKESKEKKKDELVAKEQGTRQRTEVTETTETVQPDGSAQVIETEQNEVVAPEVVTPEASQPEVPQNPLANV